MQFCFVVGIIALLSCATSARADLPAPGELSVGDGFKVSALLDSYFEHNFNTPPNTTDPVTIPQNRFRAFDQAHEQFILNAAELGIHHAAAPVGFDFVYGGGTQLTTLNGSGSEYSNIRAAALFYVTGDWTFTMGHFDANFGMERIDAPRNENYSRSLQFSLLEPMTYTGLKAEYDFSKESSVILGAANGVNRFNDNNRGKTVFAQYNLNHEKVSGGISYTGGAELANDSSHWRHTGGIFVKDDLSEAAAIGMDATLVHGSKEVIDSSGNTDSATKDAVSAYASVALCPKSKDSLRLGWLHDAKGAATLSGADVSIYELTATHKQALSKNLSAWLELRYDHATKNTKLFYDDQGSTTNPDKASQFTATLAATLEI